jgi:Asp-tRNA(Asn)/Glu-tRNA(Gln) amidotransferase A subunit family amidase
VKSLNFLSISELSNLIKSKEISPVELLKQTLDNLEKVEKKLNTFAYLDIRVPKS